MIKVFSSTLIVGLILFTAINALSQENYAETITDARLEKDELLKSRKESPLQKIDRRRFTHLSYFEIDRAWLKTAHFTLIKSKDTIDMATSSGKPKEFYTYGRIVFVHESSPVELIAYKRNYPADYTPEHEPYLFIPFTDLTNGEETYGGGRYIDIAIPDAEGEISLDFNECYNPYCAYGDGFSCPIPPKSNAINLRVAAGELNYGH